MDYFDTAVIDLERGRIIITAAGASYLRALGHDVKAGDQLPAGVEMPFEVAS